MANVGSVIGQIVGVGAGALDPLKAGGSLLDAAKGIIGMFKLDPTKKAEMETALAQAQIDIEKAQLAADLQMAQMQADVNKQEAASPNTFIAGWRPAVGWVCAFALAYAFILQPLAQFFLTASGVKLLGPLPVIDTGLLVSGLLIPMLGLGGLRTYEKVKGVADSH